MSFAQHFLSYVPEKFSLKLTHFSRVMPIKAIGSGNYEATYAVVYASPFHVEVIKPPDVLLSKCTSGRIDHGELRDSAPE